MAKNALIVGTTGLVGEQLLQLLLEDDHYDKVVAVTRRKLNDQGDKLVEVIADFDDIDKKLAGIPVDDVFCCLGTTIKKAKSNEQFRKIDYEYPLKIAELSRHTGAKQYLLISALGANKRSGIFYNKVKGEVEEAIDTVGFESYHIFRPSLLLGSRNESRAGEDAAKIFYKLFGFIFIGPLKKYRAIESSKVARAMHTVAREEKHGKYIHESNELQNK